MATTGVSLDEDFVRPLLDRPSRDLVRCSKELPIIDLGVAVRVHDGTTHEEAALKALVGEVGSACKEWGFFQLVNTGISQDLIHRLREASRAFFQLPSEIKLQVHKHKGGLGYYHGQLTHHVRDWREVFDMSASGYLELPNANFVTNDDTSTHIFHNQWPSDTMPHLREVCEEYMCAAQKIAFTIIKLVWQSLELPSTYNVNQFLHSKTHRFRFNHYPICHAPELVLGIGGHTDVGALTVLLQDDVGGLQVRSKDGEWIDVKPNPTSPVIFLGDAMQVLTNDKYKSLEHRVVVNKNIDRYSFSYSFNPDHWVDVSPIPELINEQNPPKYKPINWGKYTKCRIDGSLNNLGVKDIKVNHFEDNK